MIIKLNSIAFGNDDENLAFYNFDKEINIIHGPSNNAKTVIMLLLGYALGNSNAHHLYFNQIDRFAKGLKNEVFLANYYISHNNVEMNLKVKLECDIQKKLIYTSVWRDGLKIIDRETSSTHLRDLFFSVFSIPKKVFWKNTVRARNFDEFHSLFFVVSNLNKERGFFYDIADTKAAPLNSFISAYAFLMNDEVAIKLLRQAENFKNIEQITRRNFMLSELLNSFSNAKDESDSEKFENHKKKMLEENAALYNEIDTIKQMISSIDIKIKKLTNVEKELKSARHYNEIYPDNKIDIENFKAIINSNDPLLNLSVPTIVSIKKSKIEEIAELEKMVENNNKSIETFNKFSNEEIESYILEHGKKVIEKLNDKMRREITSDEFENDPEFEALFISWATKLSELFKDLHSKLEEKYPDTFDFLQRAKIKIMSGGFSFFVYLKLFKSLNEVVNSKNRLPLIIDSIFETNAEFENIGSSTQVEIYEEMSRNSINGFFATMTSEDYSKIKNSINHEKTNIFRDPIHNATRISLVDFMKN